MSFMVYAVTALVFVVAWTIAWFVFIRPLLKKYALTSGLLDRLDAAEGNVWAKIGLWLEAKKTLLLAVFTSGLASVKSAADQAVAVVNPDTVVALHDQSIWSAFLSDVWTMRVLAGLSLVTAYFTLKGKVEAVALTPKV